MSAKAFEPVNGPNPFEQGLASGGHPTLNKSFDSIEEFLANYYDFRTLNKADGAIGQTNPGYHNFYYGKKMWLQAQIKPSLFTALPRKPWDQSGHRLIKDFYTGVDADGRYASAETDTSGTIGNPREPDTVVMQYYPRAIVNRPYSINMAMQRLEGKDDTIAWAEMLKVLSIEYSMRINSDLARGAGEIAAPSSRTCMTPLDAIVGSYAEIANLTGGKAIAANKLDIGGMDRDAAASEIDSYVSYSNTNRELKLNYLDSLLTNCYPYWEEYTPEKKTFITNYDTVERFITLSQSQQRFVGDVLKWSKFTMDYNGVKTLPGEAIGFGVSSYRGFPIICDKMVQRDGCGRIYLVDGDVTHLQVLVPPTFLEDRSYLARGNLNTLATYFAWMETVCMKPRNNGKVRDLL